MAHIENRSRTQVKVKNRDDLTRLFPHNKAEAAQRYCAELRASGLKPLVASLDEAYLIRYYVNGKRKAVTATSAADAVAAQQRIESEQHSGLFIDYTEARRTKFADLLIRYVREIAPRKKTFKDIAYQVNRWLEDAGYDRLDIAAIHAEHKAPLNRNLHIPTPNGHRMSEATDASAFIHKGFADIVPKDFEDYIDERLQLVAPSTVDRELDVFRAVCNAAINTWRIHVQQHPMAGLERPKYFNERDRRVHAEEEARLMFAARDEDRVWTERMRADQLFAEGTSSTKYQRLKCINEARAQVAEQSLHVDMFATFIQFQLMTGARRSETLKLTWKQVDLERQTAYLPETKNGRARTLPLRSDLLALLRKLPRTSEYVFPIPLDYLRKAWARMCEAAGIDTVGPERLRIHDLRHEAISRVAEVGSQTPGGFSLLDLQAFSGHREPRMLLRYTHLTPTGLARRLDAAFAEATLDKGDESNASEAAKKKAVYHRGRIRLTKAAGVSMSEVMSAPLTSSSYGDNVVAVDFKTPRTAA